MYRLHVRLHEVDDRKVCLLSGSQHVAVCKSHRKRSAGACHFQYVKRRERRRVILAVLLQCSHKEHFAEHIKTIVACGSVGAYRHAVYPAALHLAEGSDPARQLEIRRRIRDYPQSLFPGNAHVLLIEPHAVKSASAVLEHSEFFEELRRGQPVALAAAVGLRLRFT